MQEKNTLPEISEKEMQQVFKKNLQCFHDNSISVGELVKQANEIFAQISVSSKDQELIAIILGVADLETDLRTDPELAGARLKEAYEFFKL